LTGTIQKGARANKQVLDKLKVERERGITGALAASVSLGRTPY
jgi:translation elongation factor EF-4